MRWIGWRFIGACIVVYLIYRLDVHEVVAILRRVKVPPLLLGFGMAIPIAVVKTLRWQVMVDQFISTPVPFASHLHVYCRAMVAGAITPAKVGDLIKIPWLTAHGLKTGLAFRLAILDKVLDVAGMAVLLLVAATLSDFGEALSQPLRNCIVVGLVGAVLLVVLRQTFSLKKLLSICGLTVLCIMMQVSASLLAFFSLDVDMGWSNAITLILSATLSSLVPVSVLGLGTRDVLYVLAMSRFGISGEAAIAVSTLILTIMISNVGVFYSLTWLEGNSPSRV